MTVRLAIALLLDLAVASVLTEIAAWLGALSAIVISIGILWSRVIGPFLARPIAHKVSEVVREVVADELRAWVAPVQSRLAERDCPLVHLHVRAPGQPARRAYDTLAVEGEG